MCLIMCSKVVFIEVFAANGQSTFQLPVEELTKCASTCVPDNFATLSSYSFLQPAPTLPVHLTDSSRDRHTLVTKL